MVHLCLAAWFATITPYRTGGSVLSQRDPKNPTRPAAAPDIGAPDERQHVNYVVHLLQGQGFPVFDPKDPHLYETYQSHQPPAFYVLAAGWCKLTGATDLENSDSGKRLRYLNAVLGGVEVLAVFALGFWGFKRPEIGALAAAFAALLPMNVALSGAVNNDVLLYLLCTAALAVCALGLQEGWTTKRCLAAGVLIGLALLTKTTALALLPAAFLAVMWAGKGKPKLAGWLAAAVPILVFAVPWWLRNQQLYGDPLAMHAFKAAFPGSAQAQTFIEGFGAWAYWLSWVGWWTLRSFFGAFGYMDIWLNESGMPGGSAPNALYRGLIALSLVVFLGWLLSWKRFDEGRSRAVQAMNLTFFAFVLLFFISFNMQYFQAQARYLLPAIGPISCGYALGALTLLKDRWLPALAALALIFGGTTIYAGTRLPGEFEKRTGLSASSGG